MHSPLIPSLPATTSRSPTMAVGAALRSVSNITLQGVANLIRLLPTGTVFFFQFLNPVLTNNGHCSNTNRMLSGLLLSLCGFSSCFSCFTDSYTGADGKPYYGIVTTNGLRPLTDPNPPSCVDLTQYKLRFSDFVHAATSLLVFSVIGLLDGNSVDCFYPQFESEGKALLMALPPVIGAFATGIYGVFPNKRHGFGYPPVPSSVDDGKNNQTQEDDD